MSIRYCPDHYLNYEELTAILKAWSQQYPELMHLESIGQSREGRQVWMATVTDFATGAAETKPGYFIHGNIHAEEVAGAQAAIHLLNKVLSAGKTNPRFKRLLENCALYIVPRVSPDGAEHVLDQGISRSAPVHYPYAEPLPGFYREDVNGDGQILSMLVPDRAGRFKKSKRDPRIILTREPHENDPNETYYRAMPEGLCKGQGQSRREFREPFGHDYNRNFPDHWEPEGAQWGSGQFPLSNPETRALAQTLCEKPNVFGAMGYHTFSGVVLRPPIHTDPAKMNPLDLRTYRTLGEIVSDASGYPCVSIYEGFRYEKARSISGSFDGWAYEYRGLYAFTTEIWHLAKTAGVEIQENDHVAWLFDGRGEDQLIQMLTWCDKNLEPGTYFTPWTKFDHPDFGEVEIGGYHGLFTISNPPPRFLPQELEKVAELTLRLAESGPRVVVKKCEVKKTESVGTQPLFVLEVEIANEGYLSTRGAHTITNAKAINAPRIQLKLSDGVNLIEGDTDFEIEHLDGRAELEMLRNPLWGTCCFQGDSFKNHRRLSWLVEGHGSAAIHLNLGRGGQHQLNVEF